MAVWSNSPCHFREQSMGVKTQMINSFITQTHSEIEINPVDEVFQRLKFTFINSYSGLESCSTDPQES